jgi:hypothetical protein
MTIKTLALAVGVLAAVGAAALPAAATPIPYLEAHQSGRMIAGTYQVTSQPTTRCKVNAYAVATNRNGDILSRTGRYSFNGCANGGRGTYVDFHVNAPGPGRYMACIVALNNDNYGRTVRHARCTGVTVV